MHDDSGSPDSVRKIPSLASAIYVLLAVISFEI